MTTKKALHLCVKFILDPNIQQHCLDNEKNRRDELATYMRVCLDSDPSIVNKWFDDLADKLNDAMKLEQKKELKN